MLWASALFLGIVVNLAPLALGSNRPLPWSYNAILIAVLLGIVFAAWLLRRDYHPRLKMTVVVGPLLMLGLVSFWIGFQLVPLNWLVNAHPYWRIAEEGLGEQMSAPLTVNFTATQWAAMRLLTYVVIFICAFVLARDRKLAKFIINFFIFCAVGYAIFGMARMALGIEKIIWFQGPFTTTALSSVFVGRNNAATYFGMASVTALVLFLHTYNKALKTAPDSMFRYRLTHAIDQYGTELVIFFSAFWILFTSVLLTGSRGGIISTLIAIAVAGILSFLRVTVGKEKQYSPVAISLSAALFLIIVIAALEISGDFFLSRMFSGGVGDAFRPAVYRDTIRAILDHPWAGTGYGTFESVFPLYRSEPVPQFLLFDKAHNDFLELFLGLGIPFAIVFLASLALVNYRCLKGTFDRRRDAAFPQITVCVSALVFTHSFVDFSMQIQAIAMCYAMILGTGAAQSISSRSY